MTFQTSIPIQKSDFLINYSSKLVSFGSCFAENMSDKFDYFKFQNTTNPFGIIFNPISLEKIILRSLHKKYFTENDIFYHNEAWNCFEVHSELSNPNNKTEFLTTLNQLIDTTNVHIEKLTHCLITLGTSWVYKHIESDEIVANCHKVPQKYFVKKLLSVSEIEGSLKNIISEIRSINPNAKFVFTVSPVRHSKDGFVENNVSKSHLITALYHFLSNATSSIYFPSYEIMMDELRDYRFYAEDMLHPNQTAIDYIWMRFSENFINENEFETMQHVSEIQKSLSHRPFNPNSESHLKFQDNLKQKINAIVTKYPEMKF